VKQGGSRDWLFRLTQCDQAKTFGIFDLSVAHNAHGQPGHVLLNHALRNHLVEPFLPGIIGRLCEQRRNAGENQDYRQAAAESPHKVLQVENAILT